MVDLLMLIGLSSHFPRCAFPRFTFPRFTSRKKDSFKEKPIEELGDRSGALQGLGKVLKRIR